MTVHAYELDSWFVNNLYLTDTMALSMSALGREHVHYIARNIYEEFPFVAMAYVGFGYDNHFDSCSFRGADEGWVLQDRPWYRQAVAAGGEAVFTQAYVNWIYPHELVVSIVRHMPDWYDAVVGIDLILTDIAYIAANAYVPGSGYLIILDDYGYIINHPDPAMSPTESYLRNIDEYPLLYTPLNNIKLDGTNIAVFTDAGGVESYMMTFDMASTGWTLVAIIPTSVASVPVLQTLGVVVITIAVVLILATGFTFVFLSHEFIRPIEKLTASLGKTVALDTGDIYNYSVDRSDEIGNLSQSILNMLREINTTHEIERIAEIERESNRAKSDFLARMSHEIRTPITAVLGISEIELHNPDISPQTEESFAKIFKSANSLMGIVDDILDLSKIEAGKMELLQYEYEVASMITEATHLHFAYLNGKDINFRLTVDENLPARLVGDALRIGQIVNNVLSNAFKYTQAGSVELSFAWQNELVISIRDTGLGMTPEQIIDLNKAYSRFHESEFNSISGTGLGMHIVYNLIKLMDADIEIKSDVNVGTHITIRIAQKAIGQDILGKDTALRLQQFEESTNVLKYTFTPEPMNYGRVLVVDDTEANIYVVRGLLAFYEINVDTCAGGIEALEKIKQGNIYDIVFMDFMMPDMSGTSTMRNMRKLGYTGPIIALTANAMTGKAEEFIRDGFDGFLSKPIQTEHLHSILIKHIRDKQSPEVIKSANMRSTTNTAEIDSYQRSPELIKKLRSAFIRRHANSFKDFSDAINSGDSETALYLAHTIKGSAGLIYEHALEDAAKNIEHLLLTGETPTQIYHLENELNRVLENIDETEMRAPVGSLDKNETAALFAKLEPLLRNRDVSCVDLLDELCKIPEADELCKYIQEYRFRSAEDVLAKLKADLGM
ncbi:MAG: response regulator [Defluviitaleaceae bacterium]|nr:response regulator [Defluviitaleaceae bacterium]